MQWQELVFGLGTWVFIAALIPTIRGEQKPEISTSMTNAITITAFVIAWASQDFWFSVLPATILSGAWFLLAQQRWRANMEMNYWLERDYADWHRG